MIDQLKIIICSYRFFPDPRGSGGAEKQGVLLAKALANAGVDVIYATTGCKNVPFESVVDGVTVFRFVTDRRYFYGSIKQFIYLRTLTSFLKKYGRHAQVIQSQGVWDLSAPAISKMASKLGKKSVLRYASQNELERLRSVFFLGKLYLPYVKLSSWNVTNNQNTLSTMVKRYGIDEKYCSIIPNIVETISPVDHPEIRKELGLPIDAPIVCNISNFHEGKNQDQLIKAWRLVKNHFPAATLLLVGDGKRLESCKGLAGNLQVSRQIRFVGYSDIGNKYLQASDIFAFASVSEGQSNALLEAMASGIPIVVAENESVTSSINIGTEAIGFKLDSPESTADAIISLLRDPELGRRLGRAAQKRVERYHAPHVVANQYIELYRRLLSQQ